MQQFHLLVNDGRRCTARCLTHMMPKACMMHDCSGRTLFTAFDFARTVDCWPMALLERRTSGSSWIFVLLCLTHHKAKGHAWWRCYGTRSMCFLLKQVRDLLCIHVASAECCMCFWSKKKYVVVTAHYREENTFLYQSPSVARIGYSLALRTERRDRCWSIASCRTVAVY